MKIRKTVFRSASERELFAALQSAWAEHFNVWPSLPFLNVIDVEGDEVTTAEWQQLLKTEVDITLCSKTEDRPIVSIEFDGMGHGFSRDGQYVPLHPSRDPYRKLKLDLKLRIAEQVGYPLHVISYEEKNPIGPTTTLTIADGLIGQVVARIHRNELIEQYLAENPVEDVDPSYRYDHVQDIMDSAAVVSELEWNPIAKLASDYESRLRRILRIRSFGVRHLCDPEPPPGDPFTESLEAFKARLDAIQNATRIGCRFWVDTPKGKFSETAWLRNISGRGVFPMGLAEDIAKIITYRRVAEAFGLTDEDIFQANPRG